jgi:hypothetical protein
MTAVRQVVGRASKWTTYETSRTRARRAGMCQVVTSRKFVSEEGVALLRHSTLRYRYCRPPFGHPAENWAGMSRCAGPAK